jgi:hypothetical protein
MEKHELDNKKTCANTIKDLIGLLKLFPESYKAFCL